MLILVIAPIVFILILLAITPIWSRINRFLWGTNTGLFSKDVILLTGSAGGIGRSLAPKLFYPHSPRGVILMDRDPRGLDEQYEELLQLSQQHNLQLYLYSKDFKVISDPSATCRQSSRFAEKHLQPQHATPTHPIIVLLIESDITDLQTLPKLTPLLQQHFPTPGNQCPITMLINNAGIIRPISLPSFLSSTSPNPPHQQPTPAAPPVPSSSQQLQNHVNEVAQLEQLIYNVNTHGPVNLIHSLLHAHSTPLPVDPTPLQPFFSLRPQSQLHIISVASAASMSYSSTLAAYCGSKAALVQSLRTMRLEHQRLLYDPHVPIKFPPPKTLGITHLADTDHQIKPMAANRINIRTNNQEFSVQEQQPGCQRDFYSTSPRYLPLDDGTHADKITALFKAALAQIFPFLIKPLRVPLTCLDHNVLVQPTPHVHWSTIMPWHIDTLMFNNIHTSPLIKCLVPSLSQHDVADHILQQLVNKAIDSHYFGQHSTYSESVLPFLLTFTPLFSLVPLWLSDVLVGFAGGWHAMDAWKDPRVKND